MSVVKLVTWTAFENKNCDPETLDKISTSENIFIWCEFYILKELKFMKSTWNLKKTYTTSHTTGNEKNE